MKKLKVMTIFGTRPEAIKMAPVVLELAKYPEQITPVVVVTAQHREMLDQVLRLFAITPDYDLDIMSAGQTLYDITSRALTGLRDILAAERPDLVLVHGDTTTTFTAALAAFYQQIPVGHVEAGLRTRNKYSPFPEEMNRKLTGSLTDLHFAPTETARQALLTEAVPAPDIFVTGNTVIDALLATVDSAYQFSDELLSGIDFAQRRIILMTTHRRENLGEPMRQVYQAIRRIVDEFPDVEVIFPVHKNPKVREVVQAAIGGIPRIHLCDPLDYQPFVNLMACSALILTDSGGIQEEAPSLGKPVLVLRDTTERPEAIAAGTVKLIGTVEAAVYRETRTLLSDSAQYRAMAEAANPYGDGQAALRIVQTILWRYGMAAQPPAPFASIE